MPLCTRELKAVVYVSQLTNLCHGAISKRRPREYVREQRRRVLHWTKAEINDDACGPTPTNVLLKRVVERRSWEQGIAPVTRRPAHLSKRLEPGLDGSGGPSRLHLAGRIDISPYYKVASPSRLRVSRREGV